MLGLLVLAVGANFIDVATDGEIFAAQLHQPALVDGEEVDPSEAKVVLPSYTHLTLALTSLSSTWKGRGTIIHSSPRSICPGCLTVASLISRPPPTA